MWAHEMAKILDEEFRPLGMIQKFIIPKVFIYGREVANMMSFA